MNRVEVSRRLMFGLVGLVVVSILNIVFSVTNCNWYKGAYRRISSLMNVQQESGVISVGRGTFQPTEPPELVTSSESQQHRIQKERREHIQAVCRDREMNYSTRSDVSHNFHASPQTRLLYCSVQKVGTSFWYRVMRILMGKLPKSSIFKVSGLHSGALPGAASFLKMDFFVQYFHLKTYKKFLFVRDPYVRLFSGYMDKVFLPTTIGSTAILKYRQMLDSSIQENDCESTITFAMFIRYVLNDRHVDSHFTPVYEHCNPCLVDFDYIGKMESFKEDTEYILHQVGAHMADILDDPKSFDQESDLSIIKDISTRTFKRDLEDKPCDDSYFCVQYRKLWTVFQVRGYISTNTSFPFPSINCRLVQLGDMLARLNEAYAASGSRVLRMRQREQALLEAFYSLPRGLLVELQGYLQKDCDLFAYTCEVHERFPENGYANNTFSFFKHYWN